MKSFRTMLHFVHINTFDCCFWTFQHLNKYNTCAYIIGKNINKNTEIVTPLLNQNMGCQGWQYYCHISVETKYGLLRVTILLSRIVTSLLKQNIGCQGWRVTMLLSHLCWSKIWVVEGINTIVTHVETK